MRIASALVAFVFLHAAVAAVFGPGLNSGSSGGPLKDIAEHPSESGFPTEVPVQSTPSNIPSQPPPSLKWPKPSNAPSIFPLSGKPEPSAPPSWDPDYPTPSGESHTPPPASRRAEPTEGPSPLPASYPPSLPSGVLAHPSPPFPPMKVDPSGKPLESPPPNMPGYPKVNPSMKA